MKLPDDLRHPSGGEQVDELAGSVLKLAHEAIDRFPEMKRRHMFMAGGAAVSSAVIVAAGVALLHRIRAGARPEEAVQEVTEEEIEGLHLVEREHYRPGHNSTDEHEDETAEDAVSASTAEAETTGEDSDDEAGEEAEQAQPDSRAAGL